MRLPKEKVAFTIYVTPKCKEKLDCLQQLYTIAGKKFSLSKVVEGCIHYIYNAAYYSRNSSTFEVFYNLTNLIFPPDTANDGIQEVMGIVQKKKSAAKEVLTVKVEPFKDIFKKGKKK